MKSLAVATACLGMTSGFAAAQTWTEVGDAGELPGTAQVITPGGVLASIVGTLSAGAGNPDLYLINILTPMSFSASTVGASQVNTQLFLFTLGGQGIAFNDNSGPFFQSTLRAGNPLYAGLPAGQYLLGISGSNNDPLSASGAIFPDLSTGVFGPTGPGGALSLSAWSGGGAAGSYTIFLTGTPPAPPGMRLLVLAALTGRRRRRAT